MQLENRQPAVPIDSSELLINIAHVGICGSDMHAYLGHDERRPPPLILGHEASGIVMSDGPLHAQRVAINPLVVCGACSACGSGHDINVRLDFDGSLVVANCIIACRRECLWRDGGRAHGHLVARLVGAHHSFCGAGHSRL